MEKLRDAHAGNADTSCHITKKDTQSVCKLLCLIHNSANRQDKYVSVNSGSVHMHVCTQAHMPIKAHIGL